MSMLINQKNVKALVKTNGKRISREALQVINDKVAELVNRSCKNAGGHGTVRATEVLVNKFILVAE